VSEIKDIERMLKAWKNDHDNGRIETSAYLRMKNSWETRLRQLREAKK
jgi:hypothetical protein